MAAITGSSALITADSTVAGTGVRIITRALAEVGGHLRNIRLTLNAAIPSVNSVTGGSQTLAEVGGHLRNIRLTLNSTIIAFNTDQGTTLPLAVGGSLRSVYLALNGLIVSLNGV